MKNSEIIERLLEAEQGDHARGCEGRQYTCSCGYDERIQRAAIEAASALRATLNPSTVEAGELAALREYAKAATIAITGLTGGGSEFFGRQIGDIYLADLDRCVSRIRESRDAANERWKDAIRSSLIPATMAGEGDVVDTFGLVEVLAAMEAGSDQILNSYRTWVADDREAKPRYGQIPRYDQLNAAIAKLTAALANPRLPGEG